jgi:hypothetical protein
MTPEEQARLLQEMKDQFVRSMADLLTLKAKVDGAKGGEKAAPNAGPQAGDYLADLARLGVSFYRSVLDLNATYWEKASAAAAPKKKKAAQRNRIVKKGVAAPRDENICFEIELENPTQEKGRFMFFAGDFRARNSGDVIRPPITIHPARPLVNPGATEKIHIFVPVGDVLQAGERYKGRISVRGPVDLEIILRVKVEESVD